MPLQSETIYRQTLFFQAVLDSDLLPSRHLRRLGKHYNDTETENPADAHDDDRQREEEPRKSSHPKPEVNPSHSSQASQPRKPRNLTGWKLALVTIGLCLAVFGTALVRIFFENRLGERC